MTTGYHHEIRVRFGEVDMQGVVFNSHYLAYADDAVTAWMRSSGFAYPNDGLGFDFMVVHADVDWQGSAGFDAVLEIECEVERWGTTSFTILQRMHVGHEPVCEVRLVYVSVALGTKDKMPVPEEFKALLCG